MAASTACGIGQDGAVFDGQRQQRLDMGHAVIVSATGAVER